MRIWYSVNNCGDGSAYPRFCESEALAEFAQDFDNRYEGWGEPCTGYIDIESIYGRDVELTCQDVVSAEEYWVENVNEMNEEYRLRFIREVFGGNPPVFSVEKVERRVYIVRVGERVVEERALFFEETEAEILDLLNGET